MEKCYLTFATCTVVFSATLVFKENPSTEDIKKALEERFAKANIQSNIIIIKDNELYLNDEQIFVRTVEQEVINN